MTRILIIDDEMMACRNLLAKIQELRPEFAVKTCCSPMDALTVIQAWRPNILFLDITMPGLSGFDLLEQVNEDHRTFAVVFCTAHSEFALEAFDHAALDYLLKPVAVDRLEKSLEKAAAALAGTWQQGFEKVRSSNLTKLVGRKRGKTVIYAPEQISFFVSRDHETCFHAEGEEFFCDLSLTMLENRLNSRLFFRCHRAFLINLDKVSMFDEPSSEVALMGFNERIPVAKRTRTAFKRRLSRLSEG